MAERKLKEGELFVLVSRDNDGSVMSQVTTKGKEGQGGSSFVIDRVKGRQFDMRTVAIRGRALAELLNLIYMEDLAWHCQAFKKLICKCPECIKAGRC